MSQAAEARPRFALSRDVVQAFYRLLAAALICAALALASDAFLTLGNILNVLRQTALLFLMASGLTLVILTAGLDLSVGANIGLSACLAASVIQSTGSTGLGVATGCRLGTHQRGNQPFPQRVRGHRVGQFRDYLDTLAEGDLRFEPILHRRQA